MGWNFCGSAGNLRLTRAGNGWLSRRRGRVRGAPIRAADRAVPASAATVATGAVAMAIGRPIAAGAGADPVAVAIARVAAAGRIIVPFAPIHFAAAATASAEAIDP